MIKPALYIIVVPALLYSLSCVDTSKFLKKYKITEAKLLVLFVSLGLSYLVVNFIYDFISNINI